MRAKGALPAVALSLGWLGMQTFGAHLYKMTTPEYDGCAHGDARLLCAHHDARSIDWGLGHEYRANWDTLLIALSAILLAVVVLLRRLCAE